MAPSNDQYANEVESPVHRVTVSDFSMGRYPVTFQEFRRFVDAEGYGQPRL